MSSLLLESKRTESQFQTERDEWQIASKMDQKLQNKKASVLMQCNLPPT